MDEKTALLYSQLKQYKILVNKTSGFIKWALSQVKNPYVACSFGKDSSVMLHLVLQHRPDIAVVFVRRIETDLIDNYDEIIKKWGDINLTTISYKGWLEGGEGRGIAFATKDLYKFDAYFVGLRKYENKGRENSLKIHGMFFKNKENKIRICPIADWGTSDIATYCIINKLPILNTYLIEGFDARTTAAIPSKAPIKALQSLKNRDIAAYNKLLKLLPDAKYFT